MIALDLLNECDHSVDHGRDSVHSGEHLVELSVLLTQLVSGCPLQRVMPIASTALHKKTSSLRSVVSTGL